MKDSFETFRAIQSKAWVVNIRGKEKAQAGAFLRSKLDYRLNISFWDSEEGWFFDSKRLLDYVETDYVFTWVEDHLCVSEPSEISSLLAEASFLNLDTVLLSFWLGGFYRESRYPNVTLERGSKLDWFVRDRATNEILLLNSDYYRPYLITFNSLIATSLFKKVVCDDESRPLSWAENKPFNFEKPASESKYLPLRVGVIRSEIFASIDDNLGAVGTSLIERGLYPERVPRFSYAFSPNSKSDLHKTGGLAQRMTDASNVNKS